MVKKARATEQASTNPGEGFTTFSIRLNEQQRDLLLHAATLKGWTPTQLVRTAALERAVSIHNTAIPRTFDYKGFAADLARRWFGQRSVECNLSDSDWDEIRDTNTVTVPVPPLPVDDFFKFERAVAEGGTEFLNLLREFASGLVAPHRRDLPDPVDPRRILGSEE